MRKVTVVNPQTNTPVEIQTSSQTWGDLKNDLRSVSIDPSNLKGHVRETKHSLEVDAATLPDTDFTLFLFVIKNKAGNADLAQMLVDLKAEFIEALDEAFDRAIEKAEDGDYGDSTTGAVSDLVAEYRKLQGTL